MGIMGFQDCLHMMRVPYASDAAVSSPTPRWKPATTPTGLDRAGRRARPLRVVRGSLWDRGILPQDSLKLLAEERGGYLEVDLVGHGLDPGARTHRQARHAQLELRGDRPTATISNIIGVSACIEPTFQNLYVKSNLSGEFTVINGTWCAT
jgi:ribonucleoside-diphosphate reductase alpha chain